MKTLSRRDFLKTSALVGGAGFLALQIPKIFETLARAEQGYLTPTELYSLAQPENQLYSVCLQCNTGCGIKVKILDGVAVKIDGNPNRKFEGPELANSRTFELSLPRRSRRWRTHVVQRELAGQDRERPTHDISEGPRSWPERKRSLRRRARRSADRVRPL